MDIFFKIRNPLTSFIWVSLFFVGCEYISITEHDIPQSKKCNLSYPVACNDTINESTVECVSQIIKWDPDLKIRSRHCIQSFGFGQIFQGFYNANLLRDSLYWYDFFQNDSSLPGDTLVRGASYYLYHTNQNLKREEQWEISLQSNNEFDKEKISASEFDSDGRRVVDTNITNPFIDVTHYNQSGNITRLDGFSLNENGESNFEFLRTHYFYFKMDSIPIAKSHYFQGQIQDSSSLGVNGEPHLAFQFYDSGTLWLQKEYFYNNDIDNRVIEILEEEYSETGLFVEGRKRNGAGRITHVRPTPESDWENCLEPFQIAICNMK